MLLLAAVALSLDVHGALGEEDHFEGNKAAATGGGAAGTGAAGAAGGAAGAAAAAGGPGVLSCPADLEVATDAGQAFATVSLSATMSVTGKQHSPISKTAVNSLGGQVKQLADNQLQMPLGKTVLPFAAADSAGGVATCTVLVTVIDAEPPVVTCGNFRAEAVGEEDGAEVTLPAPDATDNSAGKLSFSATIDHVTRSARSSESSASSSSLSSPPVGLRRAGGGGAWSACITPCSQVCSPARRSRMTAGSVFANHLVGGSGGSGAISPALSSAVASARNSE